LDAPVDPAETSFFVRVGIEHPRNLSGGREEISVNERVVFREEDSESRMRVIPAHDPLAGVLLVLHRVNVLPGILRERDVGSGLVGVLPFDAGRDLNAVILVLADQYSANLSCAGSTGMLPDLAHNFAVDQQKRLSRPGFDLCFHRVTALAAISARLPN